MFSKISSKTTILYLYHNILNRFHSMDYFIIIIV